MIVKYNGMDFEFSRGFLSSITCDWPSWRTHAAAILAAQPVVRVRLTTVPVVLHADDNDWNADDAVVSLRDDGPTTVMLADEWPQDSPNDPNGVIGRLLRLDWPRIIFELPAEGIREAIIAGAGGGDLRVGEGE